MPDRPLCDDGWFDTYGYILLLLLLPPPVVWFELVVVMEAPAAPTAAADPPAPCGEFGLPSLLVSGLPSEFDVVSVELCDEMCELINGWNCGYFGSMLSNRNLDIAHITNWWPQSFSFYLLLHHHIHIGRWWHMMIIIIHWCWWRFCTLHKYSQNYFFL